MVAKAMPNTRRRTRHISHSYGMPFYAQATISGDLRRRMTIVGLYKKELCNAVRKPDRVRKGMCEEIYYLGVYSYHTNGEGGWCE